MTARESPTFAMKQVSPTISVQIAQEPLRSIWSGTDWAISMKAASAAAKPFRRASFGFQGKVVSLMT